MFQFFQDDFFNLMPWYWLALIVISITSFCAACGLLLIRRLTNQQTLRKDQEIASYALNTIALLYCVIVGFVVIRVQENHSKVKEITVREANILLNLYYGSCDVFPKKCAATSAKKCKTMLKMS